MNDFKTASIRSTPSSASRVRLLWLTGALVAAVAVGGCGQKEKKPGQALASVNGEEITVLQLNEELQRANVQAAQQAVARKQLLQALVDRQLLLNEAAKDKIDREPAVVQAIERAKALIVAQAYMQKRIGATGRPGKAEVQAYFDAHPEFFIHRKQFDMHQLTLAGKDVTDELKAVIDKAKSLDEVAVWLDAHKVKYGRADLSRNSAELPPELSAKLSAMPKGQLFVIREGERSLLMSIADIKDNPVGLEVATPQIEQFLFNKKNKDAADAELARLRAGAKIEYFDKAAAPAGGAAAAAPADATNDANTRGVAGLK